MKLKHVPFFLLLFSVFLLCACTVRPNGEVIYNHVLMVEGFDDTSLYDFAGICDYVFLGEVTQAQAVIKSADERSHYKIKVLQNLKGTLCPEVEVEKHGGYLRDGTLCLLQSDTNTDMQLLPEEGKQYLFMAYAQSDGSLILTEFYGNIPYSGEAQLAEYRAYVENQTEFERERFVSKYDAG